MLASLNFLCILPKKIKEADFIKDGYTQKKTTVETLAGAISFFLNIFFDISRVFFRLSCNKRNSENWYY